LIWRVKNKGGGGDGEFKGEVVDNGGK